MKKIIIVCIIICLIMGVLGGAAWFVYITFFKENTAVVPAFKEGSLHLVIEDQEIRSAKEPRIVEGELLLPLEVVKAHIDPNIHWDHQQKRLTITTRDKVIRMKTGSLEALVNNKPMTLNIPAIEEDNAVFVPIEFLTEFYKIDITHLKQNNVIIIDFENHLIQTAESIEPEAVIRTGRSKRFPIIKKLDTEGNAFNKMRVFEEYEKWYKVRTSEGEIGFIEKRFVVIKTLLVDKLPDDTDQPIRWQPVEGKLNLTWDRMYAPPTQLEERDPMIGLDVISPTWFGIEDENGTLRNRASAKYVDWAHDHGYQVWALLANDFSNKDNTSKMLQSTSARENLIKELLTYASLYKLEGINIDFENVYATDRDALTQLVREMVPLLHEQGLTVSIDMNTAQCYDRKALSEVVDYVMIMAYDQHWSSGPSIGPVAQISWVEKLIEKFLVDIPKEKFVLGIPFYTRVWIEGATEGEKHTTQHITMDQVHEVIHDNGAEVRWDEESQQFYATYQKEGIQHRMWLEDERSINLRASLVHKYQLAGAASWSRNYASADTWRVLSDNLKHIHSYSEWKEKNSDLTHVYTGKEQQGDK